MKSQKKHVNKDCNIRSISLGTKGLKEIGRKKRNTAYWRWQCLFDASSRAQKD